MLTGADGRRLSLVQLGVEAVWYDDFDPYRPYIAFFARRAIEAGEELAFSYAGNGGSKIDLVNQLAASSQVSARPIPHEIALSLRAFRSLFHAETHPHPWPVWVLQPDETTAELLGRVRDDPRSSNASTVCRWYVPVNGHNAHVLASCSHG